MINYVFLITLIYTRAKVLNIKNIAWMFARKIVGVVTLFFTFNNSQFFLTLW